MNATPLNRPNPDVIDNAINLIRQQEITPQSPGALTKDGQVTFCAAAAVAAAGLQLQGKTDRLHEFCNEITGSESIDSIRNIFAEQGWSIDLCEDMLAINNMSAPQERTGKVVEYLRGL